MHGHQKKPELTKFYSLFKLTALCALFHEAAALPLQDTAPVACGNPFSTSCTETPGLKALNELHEVLCCSETQPSSSTWKKNAGCSVWGGSVDCNSNQTFAQAEAICEAAGARLCTVDELEGGCTTGTGCNFNRELVWAKMSPSPSTPPPMPPSPPPPSPSAPPSSPPLIEDVLLQLQNLRKELDSRVKAAEERHAAELVAVRTAFYQQLDDIRQCSGCMSPSPPPPSSPPSLPSPPSPPPPSPPPPSPTPLPPSPTSPPTRVCTSSNTFTNKDSLQDAVTLYNSDAASATAKHGVIADWCVSDITDLSCLFCSLKNFNTDISGWDTSRVTNMAHMFSNAFEFNQPLSFDTSRVTTMHEMFELAKAFNQPLDIDTSKVKIMSKMFHRAWAFNQPLNFDTGSAMDMHFMFYNARAFNQPLSWDTSSVTNMDSVFQFAAAFNQPLSWDTSRVTSMRNMFLAAEAFNADISGWDISRVTEMRQMFGDTNSLSDANKRFIRCAWAGTSAFVSAGYDSDSWASGSCPSS